MKSGYLTRAYLVVSNTRINRSSPKHFDSVLDGKVHTELEVYTSLKSPMIPLRKSNAMM